MIPILPIAEQKRIVAKVDELMQECDAIETHLEQQQQLAQTFAASLYGWTCANDHQFLFNNHPPRLIHSVDHGHFFPNGPEWKKQDLQKTARATLDSFFAECSFTADELSEGRQALVQITQEQLIRAVAIPPDQWGLTIEARVALVEYLTKRKEELLTGDLKDKRQSNVKGGN